MSGDYEGDREFGNTPLGVCGAARLYGKTSSKTASATADKSML